MHTLLKGVLRYSFDMFSNYKKVSYPINMKASNFYRYCELIDLNLTLKKFCIFLLVINMSLTYINLFSHIRYVFRHFYDSLSSCSLWYKNAMCIYYVPKTRCTGYYKINCPQSTLTSAIFLKHERAIFWMCHHLSSR